MAKRKITYDDGTVAIEDIPESQASSVVSGLEDWKKATGLTPAPPRGMAPAGGPIPAQGRVLPIGGPATLANGDMLQPNGGVVPAEAARSMRKLQSEKTGDRVSLLTNIAANAAVPSGGGVAMTALKQALIGGGSKLAGELARTTQNDESPSSIDPNAVASHALTQGAMGAGGGLFNKLFSPKTATGAGIGALDIAKAATGGPLAKIGLLVKAMGESKLTKALGGDTESLVHPPSVPQVELPSTRTQFLQGQSPLMAPVPVPAKPITAPAAAPKTLEQQTVEKALAKAAGDKAYTEAMKPKPQPAPVQKPVVTTGAVAPRPMVTTGAAPSGEMTTGQGEGGRFMSVPKLKPAPEAAIPRQVRMAEKAKAGKVSKETLDDVLSWLNQHGKQ